MNFSAAETLAFPAGKYEVVPDFMSSGVHKKIAGAVRHAAIAGFKACFLLFHAYM